MERQSSMRVAAAGIARQCTGFGREAVKAGASPYDGIRMSVKISVPIDDEHVEVGRPVRA